MKPVASDFELSHRFRNMSIVAAFLVVWKHISFVSSVDDVFHFVTVQFAAIAVPFFFFAAGFFLAVRFDDVGWWRSAVVKRMKTLVIPWFFWSLLLFLLGKGPCLVKGLFCGQIPDWNLDFYLCAFGLNFLKDMHHAPLWFVRALFILVMVSPFLRYLARMQAIAALWFWFLLKQFPGCLPVPPAALVYFLLGIYLCRSGVSLTVRRDVGCFSLIVGVILILLSAGVSGLVPDEARVYLRFIQIPFCLIGVWSLMPTSAWSVFIVQNAFPIYLVHMLVISVVKALAGPQVRVFALPLVTEWGFALMAVGVFAVSILIAETLRRFLPRMANVVFGGR